MVSSGAFVDRGKRGVVEADWDDPGWAVADGSAATSAQSLDVVGLDLFLGHGDAVDGLLHVPKCNTEWSASEG